MARLWKLRTPISCSLMMTRRTARMAQTELRPRTTRAARPSKQQQQWYRRARTSNAQKRALMNIFCARLCAFIACALDGRRDARYSAQKRTRHYWATCSGNCLHVPSTSREDVNLSPESPRGHWPPRRHLTGSVGSSRLHAVVQYVVSAKSPIFASLLSGYSVM